MLSSIGNDMIQQQQQQKTQQMQQYKKNHIQTYSTAKTVAKRILLVSSEDDVNLALKLALEKEREQDDDDKSCFKVDSFNNPILALKDFKIGFYDLLIIDIVMPQMNGFELSERIRKVDDKVKLCFMTAGEIPSKVRFDPFSQGYQDRFVRLPIENEVLIEHIGHS